MNQQVNLYRPIFRKQEKKFSALAMVQAGAVMLVGIALIYGAMGWQLTRARADLRQAERRHAEVAARLQSVMEKFGGNAGQSVDDRISELQKEVGKRHEMQLLLARNVSGNHRGFSDYFMALARQSVDGVWITNFAIVGAGDDLRLKGRTVDAARVPRFVQRLASEQAMAGKEFETFVMTNDSKRSVLDFILKTTPGAEAAAGDSGRS